MPARGSPLARALQVLASLEMCTRPSGMAAMVGSACILCIAANACSPCCTAANDHTSSCGCAAAGPRPPPADPSPAPRPPAVAAKVLRRSDEIAVGDFRTEIAILRKVHHPNCVQVGAGRGCGAGPRARRRSSQCFKPRVGRALAGDAARAVAARRPPRCVPRRSVSYLDSGQGGDKCQCVDGMAVPLRPLPFHPPGPAPPPFLPSSWAPALSRNPTSC
jgi:hypothetical protein